MHFDRRFLRCALPISILQAILLSDALGQDESLVEACAEPRAQHRAQLANHGEDVLEASVSWVADGDSIWVRMDGREIEVRLADIDAPERDQPYAWEAKLALIDLVRGQQLRLIVRDKDRHGRIVARVWIDDLDVSRELVRKGAVWFYPAFRQDHQLLCEERRARSLRRGFWAQPTPQAPWARRREMYEQESARRK